MMAMLGTLTMTVTTSASASNRAMSWGYGLWGRLGNGVTRQTEHKKGDISVPSPVCGVGTVGQCPSGPYLNEVSAMSAGGSHSVALLSDGTVVSWGENESGQLGDGTSTGPSACVSAAGLHEEFEETRPCSATPVAVSGLTGVTAISAGGAHSLALLSSGTVMAWGANGNGQLGDGKTENSDVPVAVSGLSGVTAISAGGGDSLALLSNGTVVAWGDNEFGQLGDGTTKDRHTPVPVSGLSGVSAIATSGSHSMAMLSDDTVMAWGANNEGQLGDGSTEASTVPVVVSSLRGVAGVSAGPGFSFGRLSSGAVMSWGSNGGGQLGVGGEDETLPFSDVPVEVCAVGVGSLHVCHSGPFLSSVSAVSAGYDHSLALLETGAVVSWGRGCDGELGNGGGGGGELCETGIGIRYTPVEVSGLSDLNGVSAGNAFSLAFGPAAPSVASVGPNQGLEAGGTTVQITGTNFVKGATVDFGATSATKVTVNSPTMITATSPAGTGTVDVTVTTPEGTSSIVSADRFKYVVAPPPTVTKLKPAKGTVAGNTTLTISGANFTEVESVKFGSIDAASYKVNSASSITAVSPPQVAGIVNVTVTTANGTSALSTKNRFRYTPEVTSVSPNRGSKLGGTSVTVSGAGFVVGTTATVFKFGTTKVTSVNCTSTTACTVVTPAHAVGTVDVKATVNKVASAKHPPADQFTYE